MAKNKNVPVLLHDAKRCFVYQYGTDGKITVSKRLELGDEYDLVEALESGNIEVENASDCKKTITISGIKVDEEAFAAIDMILETMEEQ